MADFNPGAQYMNWQQYGGSNSLLGDFGDATKKWLGAYALQKSGAVDFLDSIGAPESLKKSIPTLSGQPPSTTSQIPVIPPIAGAQTSSAMPMQPVVPVAPAAPQIAPMTIPGVGEIKGLSDKTTDFLKAIWGNK